MSVRLDNNESGHTVYWDNLLLVLEENQVTNGDFELASVAPFNTALNGTLAVESNAQDVFAGDHSMKYMANQDDSYTSPWYGTSVATLDPTEQHSFRFSAAVKGEASNSAELFVVCEKTPSDREFFSEEFSVTTDWEIYELTGTCSEGTVDVRIRLDNNDAGATLYWDNLVLSVLQ